MSDIPLSSLRKNKNRTGYTQLPDTDDGEAPSSPSGSSNMHAVIAASTASPSLRKMGKRRTQYADEPDEEAGLLGDVYEEADDFERDIERNRPVVKSVRALHSQDTTR